MSQRHQVFFLKRIKVVWKMGCQYRLPLNPPPFLFVTIVCWSSFPYYVTL